METIDFTDITYKAIEDTSITKHHVFPGITLIYNDIHTGQYPAASGTQGENILVITYCRQGRIEWEFHDGRCCYLGEDDLSICMQNHKIMNVSFPLNHYHGVSLIIDIDEVKTIKPMLKSFKVDLPDLREHLCGNGKFFVKRKDEILKHIFTEFYTIPEKIREHYFKIKVLELLLFLSIIEDSENDNAAYFKKSDIKKVKMIKEYLISNLSERVTVEELSEKFSFPLTSLKLCFKEVYGVSVSHFIRSYRMHTAALLLKSTDETILNIAGKVGYTNASKFSSVFKSEFGILPLHYRKNF